MKNKLIIALAMISFFQLMTLNVNAQSSEEEQVRSTQKI